MQAISFSAYDGPEVLRLGPQGTSEPRPEQVRVAVRAAAVNAFDTRFRRGLMAPDLPPSFPSIPGYDVAGVVHAVAAGVSVSVPGDGVMCGSASGAYAEVALADATATVRELGDATRDVAGGSNSVARTALLGSGRQVLAVQRTFPLADAAAAQEQAEGGHAWGRLVLIPS